MLLPARWPRPLRLALYALAVAILLWLTLAPQQALPPEPGFGDKWDHALAWTVLVLSGLVLAPRRPLALAAFALALGVVVEVLQGVMAFGRDSDWRDLIADAAGVALAFLIAWGVRRMTRRG
jgi:VanZ family protein